MTVPTVHPPHRPELLGQLWTLKIDFRLDSLREQPEFIALKNRITDDVSRALAEIKSVNLALY